MMDAVYVIEPGSYLRREGESLKIMLGGRMMEQIPAKGLKRLTLIGILGTPHIFTVYSVYCS